MSSSQRLPAQQKMFIMEETQQINTTLISNVDYTRCKPQSSTDWQAKQNQCVVTVQRATCSSPPNSLQAQGYKTESDCCSSNYSELESSVRWKMLSLIRGSSNTDALGWYSPVWPPAQSVSVWTLLNDTQQLHIAPLKDSYSLYPH